MREDWVADIDARQLPSGLYSPVLILTPPSDVGPPMTVDLAGEYPTAEHARLAGLDAVTSMALR